MPRAQVLPEVEVLQFFEEAPIEKAETVFNIVAGKMRARVSQGSAPERRNKKRPAPNRAPEGASDTPDNK